MLVSHSSLNLLPLDKTCSQIVCPDVGTPSVLLWVPWCMILSEIMRAGRSFVPAPALGGYILKAYVLWCS